MRFPILHVPFYLGLCVYFIAMLFKIQQWPGAQLFIMSATVILCVFLAMVLVEMVSSHKADMAKKLVWGAVYTIIGLVFLLFFRGVVSMLVILVLGLAYIRGLRKQFLFTKKEIENNNWDSVKTD